MFPYLLVLLSIGTGEQPEPVASFITQSNCESLANLLNRGFEKKDMNNKAICLTAVKDAEI